ncbi:MAG: endonuclease/exonuclease/phosphatase family protein [Opitutales bacterium]
MLGWRDGRRGVRLLWAGGLAVLCGVAEAGETRSPTFSLMTWNVRNYNASHRLVDGTFRPDYPKPEAEKAALRAVLLRWRPDILLLQEMGPAPYLLELRRDLARAGLDYPETLLAAATDAERHLALLSRIPVLQSRVHKDLPFTSQGVPYRVKRGLLEAGFLWEQRFFRLFGVHLKSGFGASGDDPGWRDRRAGEARTLRNRILAVQPEPEEQAFLVAGDFNSTVDRPPVRRFLSKGNRRLADWLPAVDSREEVWTYYHRASGSYRRVDLILQSPGFARQFVVVEVRVIDDREVLAASDHRPVWVSFSPRDTSR